MKISADRSVYPDMKWVSRCFQKYIKSLWGSCDGPDAAEKVNDRVRSYNEKHGQTLAKFIQMEDGRFAIVYLDELNIRVHASVPAAGDIVFVDATSGSQICSYNILIFLIISLYHYIIISLYQYISIS